MELIKYSDLTHLLRNVCLLFSVMEINDSCYVALKGTKIDVKN